MGQKYVLYDIQIPQSEKFYTFLFTQRNGKLSCTQSVAKNSLMGCACHMMHEVRLSTGRTARALFNYYYYYFFVALKLLCTIK